jgi:BirA family biotin operon repressor/biotin-[acetyl-CoA-carboxylase] ligase
MTAPTPLRWPAEAIWEAASPLLPGFTVEVLPEIDSTNTELMRRARQDRTEPVLLVAQTQTAGRGRLGRSWVSGAAQAQAGTDQVGTANANPNAHAATLPSLTFSIGLPLAAADWSGLSLAVGVSLALSLHADIRLKWPNDLWVNDCKLGGILIETTPLSEAAQAEYASTRPYAPAVPARYVVVGVGLNIALPQAQGLNTPPAALQNLLPAIDAPQALGRVAAPLLQTLKRFETAGFAPFASAFAARDALAGRDVTLSDGTIGVAGGVDEGGALRVRTAQGWVSVNSAEVSVRPTQPGSTPA